MELDNVEKPLRQMRKLLKNLPSNPDPGEVHKLRTRARKIEAVAAALEPAGGKRTKRLLKAIKPVRKAAGGVRDMDVLTGDLLELPKDSNHASLVKLMEHLGSLRQQSADSLAGTVHRQRKPARRFLKEYARLVESVANGKRRPPLGVTRALESDTGRCSAADDLMAALRQWPRLDAHNLHPFRLKVKELRYVLQLFADADPGLVDMLNRVKDNIGDWHDWQQLLEIARQVLDAQDDRALLAHIEITAKKKLARALASSNALRRRYLHNPPAQRKVS